MPVLQAKNLKLSYTSGSVSCLLAEIKWKQWTESGTGRKNLKERDRQKEVETWVYRQWEKDKVREHRKWLGHTIQCCCWVPCLLCALAQCPFVNLRKLGTALQIYIFFATLFTPSRSYLISGGERPRTPAKGTMICDRPWESCWFPNRKDSPQSGVKSHWRLRPSWGNRAHHHVPDITSRAPFLKTHHPLPHC